MNIYVDLDGVLADFDGYFEKKYLISPREWEYRWGEDDFWKSLNQIDDFFYNLSPLPDAHDLMDYLRPFDPIILTAATRHRPTSCNEKIRWVADVFGPEQRVITVLGGKNKHWHCRRGDILIDDWEAHANLWRSKGGIWITHRNVPQTLKELKVILRDK